MITRITHQMTQRTSLENIQTNLRAMSKLQGQASSLRRIEKPSDDPAGTAQALRLRSESRALSQYDRNASDGAAWLTTVDTALTTASTQLTRARTLAIQGANSGTMNAQSREAIAQEIEAARDALLGQANTTYLGRAVFAGTSDASAAFERDPLTGTYTHNGTAGTVDRRIAEDVTVRVDGNGGAVFGTGATSVFATLDRLAADLRAGADVTGYIDEIDAHHDAILQETATIGARTNQIEAQLQANASKKLAVKADISAVEDVDLAETLVNLQAQEVAYQAALGATSRVLQPTLLDFIR